MRLRGVEYLRWREGGPAELTHDEIQCAGLQVTIEVRLHESGAYCVFIGRYSSCGLRVIERQCLTVFIRPENAMKWAKVMSSDAHWLDGKDLMM